MQQTFKCKEPGCDKKVSYEYSPIETAVEVKSADASSQTTETAYLTCAAGHTYPYEVRA